MSLSKAALGIAAPLCVLLGSPRARADKVQYQGAVSLSTGWTDNVAAAPTTPGPGMRGPESDVFLRISPNLSASFLGGKAIHRVSYTYSRDQYIDHSEASSNTHRADWSGVFQPTSQTQLLVGADVAYGQLNTFNRLLSPSAATIGAIRPGTITFVSGGFREALTFTLMHHWRAMQNFEMIAFAPTVSGQPSTYAFTPRFVLDRQWATDALGFDTGIAYILYGEVANAMGMTLSPARQQLLLSLLGRWRRDYNFRWSSEVSAGMVFGFRPNDGGARVAEPAGGASLRYTHDRGAGEISVSHTILPNPIVGNLFANDIAALRVHLPLEREPSRFHISGSLAYQYGRLLDVNTGQRTATVNVVLADAGLSYLPMRELETSVRYTYYDQSGDGSLPSIASNSIIFSIAGRYPAEITTPPTNPALRVDQSDQVDLWRRSPGERSGGAGGAGSPGSLAPSL